MAGHVMPAVPDGSCRIGVAELRKFWCVSPGPACATDLCAIKTPARCERDVSG